MGVVSGIVMSYQFGTNWSVFADKAGPVIGPLMGYEVLTAFFLEAGFLGVMLFGRRKVGPGLHFLATLMVAVGTLGSAFWILSVNSLDADPGGPRVNADGQFVPVDWWAVVFNPSFPYRLVHMVLAAYLTTALVVGGVGAWHLLRDRIDAGARKMFAMAMGMIVAVAPIQIVAGDLHGLNTLEHQPAKIAAMEGHFETRRGAPLILFGIPDNAAEETRFAVEVPRLGSLILTHHWDGEVRGLKAWPADQRPNPEILFWSFRLMVGLGFAMLGLGAWAASCGSGAGSTAAAGSCAPRWRWRRPGFVAVLAGWVTTEVGRQPWTVYGLLSTADSVAPLQTPAVASSLVAFVLVYFAVFGAGAFYLLRLMRQPPEAGPRIEEIGPTRAAGVTPGPAVEQDVIRRNEERAMGLELSFVWAGLIAFAVLAYVVLDGFDLGVGILFPLIEGEANRDLAMNTVAPVWDGNETWLVLGGGGLFAVFPLAYAVVMPALYAPITAMLLALVFRGVAFEFRWRTRRGKFLWDLSFFGGSLLATFAQGVALGALVQGIAVENRAYAGGNWDWLTPFSLLTGVALVVGYTLLGASWLVMKTDGYVRMRAERAAWVSGAGTVALIGLVSLVTPFLDPAYLARWFEMPNVLFTIWVPMLLLVAVFVFVKGLREGRDTWPFLAAQSMFVLSFIGLGISFYPNIVPPDLTIRQAAAPDASLAFLLAGAAVLVPMILAYTAYAYWVFRGKIDPEAGYH